MNQINNSYIEGMEYGKDKIKGILVNLNWYNEKYKKETMPSKKEIRYSYPKVGEEDDYLLKIININLDYYSKICYDKVKKEDSLWKLFTIKKKDELSEFTKNEEQLSNYRNKLNRLSKSKEYCRMVWDERIEKNLRAFDEYQSGLSDGERKGREEGSIDTKKEMIINFYHNGASIDLISKSVGLTMDEVEKIIKDEQNK